MKNFVRLIANFCIVTITNSFIAATGIAEVKGQTAIDIHFQVEGTIEGYSYPSKLMVQIDGQPAGENSVKDQKEANSVHVTTTPGHHQLRCSLWALYNGQWEERLIATGYSMDWVYEGGIKVKRKMKKLITFDIGTEKVTVK